MKIPFVRYHVTKDVRGEPKRHRDGELDVAHDIPLNEIKDMKTATSDQAQIAPSTEITCQSVDPTREVFENPDLRPALSLAIGRGTLANKTVKDEDIRTYSLSAGFNATCLGPVIAEASLVRAECGALAKALCAKAGYGPANPLKILIATTINEDSKRLRRARR